MNLLRWLVHWLALVVVIPAILVTIVALWVCRWSENER